METGGGGAAMGTYEKGAVRIHFEEAGSGFPLLLIAAVTLPTAAWLFRNRLV